MQKLKIQDTDRRAFLGFRLQGYFSISDCWTYTAFEIVWADDRKEDIREEKEDDVLIKISMN